MKKRISIFALLLCLLASILPGKAMLAYDDQYAVPFADYTGYIAEQGSETYTDLYYTLQGVGEAHGLDVAVVVIDKSQAKSLDDMDASAVDVYQQSGYGKDTVMMLIALGSDMHGKYQIIGYGKGQTAVNNDAIDYMVEHLDKTFKSQDFIGGIKYFADETDKCLKMYEEGKPFKKPFEWPMRILISLGIGLVIGLIVALCLRGQLKSVKYEHGAANYTIPGSMHVTASNDVFLYKNVSRTKRQSSSSSGGGGGSHSSGGGSF
ncbi:MAG: TPM domain-containing protein [Eubacterium sp.]|nr:TPM domain-containing protein [Eubacterium sp.]